MPKLENWGVVIVGASPYTAPELMKMCLHGNVYGHESNRFSDGEAVRTSSIRGKRGTCVVTRSGSIYELGAVANEYENQFPDAKNRLLESLEEV